MNPPNLLKKIFIYLFIFYGFTLLGFLLLKGHFFKNFSPQLYDQIINGQSIFKDKTDDPCFYQIYGDPDVGKNYLKVNLYCNENSTSANTISLDALKRKTVEEAIKTLGKINGFSVVIDSNKITSLGKLENNQNYEWRCLVDKKTITKISTVLPEATILNCYYSKIGK